MTTPGGASRGRAPTARQAGCEPADTAGGIADDLAWGEEDSIVPLLERLKSAWPGSAGPSWPEAGARFGRFVLQGMLGKGGYGLVFLATDTRLGRRVALKVLGPRAAFDPVAAGSLLREARTAAALSHPNIVPVLEVGEEGPVWFVVMAYCELGSLADRLAAHGGPGGGLPAAEAAELVAQVADGIQHAHDRGVLHRDLKPSNVLLAEAARRAGEAPGLVALVGDFGLARFEADESQTPTGFPLGTRPYMSPEQARGEVRGLGRETDVYGLGVVLFEAVTGRRPFTGSSPEELLARIQTEEAPSARSILPSVPPDLSLIIRHCLEKEPADRYPSAAELAVDLRRFLRGDPLLRRRSPWKRARSWARRHPAAATVALIGSALVGIAVPAAEVMARRRAEERVERLVEARPGTLPGLLASVDALGRRAVGPARRHLLAPEPSRRFRAALPLIRRGDRAALDQALRDLADAGPEEVAALAESAARLPAGQAAAEVGRWLGRGASSDSHRLRLAAALVALGETPPESSWPGVAAGLAADREPFGWAAALRPSSRGVAGPLGQLLREAKPGAGRAIAALLVGGEAAEQEELAALLLEAAEGPRREVLDELLRLAPAVPRPAALLDHLATVVEETATGPCEGRRRAIAAAALIRLDPAERAAVGWGMLDRGADPAGKAFLIRSLVPAGIGVEALLARIAEEGSPSRRRAMLLALGRARPDEAAAARGEVLRLYESAPEAEVHSACRWLLRRWSADDAELAGRVARLDRELAGRPADPSKWWRVHPLGITLLRVELPVLGRTIEVSDTEITVAQFRRWKADHPTSGTLGHDPDNPAYYVDCASAVKFCLALSRHDGIGPEGWSYRLTEDSCPVPDPSKLDLPGYRLPTEEEFQAVSRAGAEGPWHFGDCPELLGDYTWYTGNAEARVHPVATRQPNEFGLFDTIGNAMEWCAADPTRTENWPKNQAVLGGSYLQTGEQLREGPRFITNAEYNGRFPVTPAYGFRIARTWHPAPERGAP